jgi:hypothetical protein
VGFVVDKVALAQVVIQFLRFSPVNIIAPSFSILIYHLEDAQYVHWWQQFRGIVSPHKINQSIDLGTSDHQRNEIGQYSVYDKRQLAGNHLRDKHDVHILTNIHNTQALGNFYDMHGNSTKLAVIQDYNINMEYVNKSNTAANSYLIQCHSWK